MNPLPSLIIRMSLTHTNDYGMPIIEHKADEVPYQVTLKSQLQHESIKL
jgi:hypothetical protein